RDPGLDRLVAAERGVGLAALEELLDGALPVERRPPAEVEHVAGGAVLDLVEMGAPLVDDHVDLEPDPAELGGDGEGEVLVEGIAPRRRVERELELARVEAGLLEERLGP